MKARKCLKKGCEDYLSYVVDTVKEKKNEEEIEFKKFSEGVSHLFT